MSSILQYGLDWSGADLSGCVAQRKVDGHRAFWTGEELLTRGGMRYSAPEWFTAGLPKMALDCEITCGGEGAGKVNGLRRRDGSKWPEARLHVFDAPDAEGCLAERLAAIHGALGEHRFSEILAIWEVKSTDGLLVQLTQCIAAGWEGFVVRPADAGYNCGRNGGILKLTKASGALEWAGAP